MKNLFSFFPLIILITISSVTANEFLIRMDDFRERRDFFVIQHIGSQLIIIAQDTELRRLNQLGYSYKLLDENPHKKLYYLVYPIRVKKETICRVGEILDEYNVVDALPEYRTCYLVRVSRENEEILFDLAVELDYLEFDRIRFNTPVVPKIQKTSLTPDPLIQSMVDAVSMDSLRTYVRYLQDSVSSRSARYQSNLEEAVPWILEKFRTYGCDSVFTQEVPNYQYAPNPIGIKLGTEHPSYSTYFIIGGHNDAVPHAEENKGADDNASGTAAVIEAARVMQQYKFNYTIIYMGFDGEEVGLRGSAEFASVAEEQGDTILGVLAIDMIGRTSGSADYLRVRYNTSIPGCQAFGELFDDAASVYTDLQYQVSSSTGGGSDHASFWNRNFIALFLIESAYGSNDANHLSWDTLDCPQGMNDSEFMTQSTQACVAALATAAEVNDQTKILTDSWGERTEDAFSMHRNSQGKVTFTFMVKERNDYIRIQVYTVSGQVIQTIASGDYQKGSHTIVWDGSDVRGKPVAQGIYFISCSSRNSLQIKKFMY